MQDFLNVHLHMYSTLLLGFLLQSLKAWENSSSMNGFERWIRFSVGARQQLYRVTQRKCTTTYLGLHSLPLLTCFQLFWWFCADKLDDAVWSEYGTFRTNWRFPGT